jgi:hypothetical protein
MMITFKYEFKDVRDQLTTEVEYTIHDDSLPEIVQSFRQFLMGIGFHPDSVKAYIEED